MEVQASHVRRWTATVGTLLAAGLAAATVLAPTPAAAYWGDYTTDLPRIVTGPTPFTVTPTDVEVCGMTYRGQVRDARLVPVIDFRRGRGKAPRDAEKVEERS